MSELAQIIKQLVTLNYNYRDASDESCLSECEYRREFKTVRVNPGRKTGKTTAIKELARPRDLIIVPNRCISQVMRLEGHIPCEITTIDECAPSRMALFRFNWVFVDEPKAGRVNINYVYETIDADIYIILGE